jgi:hypothetical protein
MKKLCAQLLTVVGAMPRMRKYLLAVLGIGLAGSLIGIVVAAAAHASFAGYVLTS